MHGQREERNRMLPAAAAAPPPSVASPPPPSPSSSESFLKDGRKIKAGDCALFQAGDSAPFIAIINWFARDKEGYHKICVNWLYRPADVKLAKGVLLEAGPNEVFYAFHKDVVPAASLLHPCKVAFLRRGVELPVGISSFVCRRVYDIANKCLWWLTDQDYINERQEEVDKLLNKTQIQMHATLQSGGRSPKPLNGLASSQQLKVGPENVQNSGTSFPSQAKGRKRERSDQGTELTKRERFPKPEDVDSGQIKSENMLKEEISKITERGGLVCPEGVEKLVNLILCDRTERRLDVPGRILVAEVIAATDREDCLCKFVQLKGVPILDDWLQETHKGKTSDGISPKEGDNKTSTELLLALLRALDKLPVDLLALQTCQIGRSVNHLRGHKNSDIQKKARSLVDTWKRRVDLEMTKINDAKSGSSQPVTSPAKPGFSDVPGSKRSGANDAHSRNASGHSSAAKSPAGKTGLSDFIVKSGPVTTSGSLKSAVNVTASVAASSKDLACKIVLAGVSESPVAVKEEKSSSSSQSHNNSHSCSSDHAKTTGSSCKEDARSSTAGSRTVTKRLGGSSQHRRSSSGLLGVSSRVHKETNLGKSGSLTKITTLDRASQSGLTFEKTTDTPIADHASGHKIIVKLHNTARSPARSFNGGYLKDPLTTVSRASSPGIQDRHEHIDCRTKPRSETSPSEVAADGNTESWQSNDVKEGLVGVRSPTTICDEEHSKTAEDARRANDAPITSCSSSGNEKGVFAPESRSRNSFSSMHALIESCASLSVGDDIGMKLLASVATGEISKSELIPSNGSPGASPAPKDDPCAGINLENSTILCNDDAILRHAQADEGGDADSMNHGKSVGSMLGKEESDKEDSNSSASTETTTMYRDNGSLAKQTEQSPISASPNKVENFSCKSEDKLEDTQGHCLSASKSLEVEDDSNGEASKSQMPDETRLIESSLSSTSIVNCKSLDDGQNVVGSASIAKSEERVIEELSFTSAHESQGIPMSSDQQKFLLTVNAERSDDAFAGLDESMASKPDELGVGQLKGSNVAKQDPAGSVSSTNVDLVKQAATSLGNTGAIVNFKTEDAIETCADVTAIQEPPSSIKQEAELHVKSTGKMSEHSVPENEEIASSAVATEPDGVVFDFDLNEGIPGDDGNQADMAISAAAVSPTTLNLQTSCSYANSMLNCSQALITVAAPAKGPFVPPENLLKSKSKPGWRGSAATSAFRPAEPRRTLETASSDAAVNSGRPLLDIDLNVPDEGVLEDMGSRSIRPESSVGTNNDALSRNVGLDLDLNKADEGTEIGQFVANKSCREVSFMPSRSASAGLSSGEANASRGFDLNNGPNVEEGIEHGSRNQHLKSANVPFIPSVPGLRINNPEIGIASTWIPPGSSYPPVGIPSFFPARGEQSYPILAAPGAPRIFGPVTSGTFGSDIYRGPVLSSSPAMAFSPATAFPYTGLPFGSGFPLASTSFPGGSTTYADAPSGSTSCFPGMPSQLVGPAGGIPSHYPRPYIINLPEGSSSVGSNRQGGLDLNAGPRITDAEGKDERFSSAPRQVMVATSQAFVEDQSRLLGMPGGSLKRKEPEGGWDAERLTYRQLQWQ